MDLKPLKSPTWQYVAVLLVGGLLPGCFAPFNLGYLAPLALAFLFYSWQFGSVKSAVIKGYLFGLGLFSTGTSWVYISMHEYGGATPLAAFILTLLFINILAGFTALSASLARYARPAKHNFIWMLIIAPMAWVFGEWCRSWFMTGFPWLTLGYSQLTTVLAGFAPITGVFGLSFLIGLAGALLLGTIKCRNKARYFSLGGVATLLIGGYLLQMVAWSEPAGQAFTASLIQGNIDQAIKWQPEVRRQTLMLYMEKTREHWDSDVILWPETAVPAYYHQVRDPIFLPLWREAKNNHTDLLFGVPVVEQTSGRYFNAMVSLTGDSEMIYQKRHLVPFGEYLPLKPVSNIILDYLQIPMSDFSPGQVEQPLLQAGGYPFVTSICYEDVFGAESLVGIESARYLVNISNDAWFSGSVAPFQHLQMAQMRALETSRYMLRATNTGMTAIINELGEITEQAPPYQQAVITGQVIPLIGQTPYSQTGDWPILTFMFLSLIGGLVLARKNNS